MAWKVEESSGLNCLWTPAKAKSDIINFRGLTRVVEWACLPGMGFLDLGGTMEEKDDLCYRITFKVAFGGQKFQVLFASFWQSAPSHWWMVSAYNSLSQGTQASTEHSSVAVHGAECFHSQGSS